MVDMGVQQERRAFIRAHGKDIVEVDIPVDHQIAEYLDAYIAVAGIVEDKNGFLFRNSLAKSKQLIAKAMSCIDALGDGATPPRRRRNRL